MGDDYSRILRDGISKALHSRLGVDDYLRNLRDGKLGDDYFFFSEYETWALVFGNHIGHEEFEYTMENLFKDVRKMLEIRDKIIKECLDKEKLEKAKSRLALSKALHSRLGADTPLDIDIMDKINKNLTGRGKSGKKHSKKRNSKKRKNTKKKSK